MIQNFKDWKTTLPGLIIVALVFGLNLLKVKHPELRDAADNATAGITALAGGTLILGARSGQ